MHCEPTKEHQWLKKFVGEWTSESECAMSPDKPNEKFTGSESAHMVGDLWMVANGRGNMPGGGEATMVLTIGYDPETGKFIGTWFGSMMTTLWIYEGTLDPTGKILALHAEGPDMSQPGKTGKYRDSIEFKSDDHRVLTSAMLGEDGKWQQFMTAHYRRSK